jgi:hypothetical protein
VKAALLIDWENLVGHLAEDPYWVSDPVPEIKKLLPAIEEHARTLGATSIEKHYFHSVKKDIGQATERALLALGFTRVTGTEAKNAADTRLIVHATRQQASGFELFYVVTGDEDFADLAFELERDEEKCYLCPVDQNRLRGPIKSWKRKVFVDKAAGPTGLIDVTRNPRPTAEKIDEFILCLQWLVDGGNHMGDWNQAADRISTDFPALGGLGAVTTLMQQAERDNLIWSNEIEINGRRQRRRRLRYENGRLMRMLSAADLMFEEIRRKHGTASLGDLLNVIPAQAQTDFPALPDMLRAAGYLDSAGASSYAIGSGHANNGILRALRRLALSVWHTDMQEPARPGVDSNKIHERWTRQVFGAQRDQPKDKIDQALEEGRAMVRRGLAAGLLIEANGSQPRRKRYEVLSGHPLVDDSIAVAKLIWELLPADFLTVGREEVLASMEAGAAQLPALGVNDRERSFWLSALAGAGVIRIPKDRVVRAQNTVLRNHWP